MKKIKKTCAHCYQSFALQRNPQQSYCSQNACQNRRKQLWRKRKHTNDPDYRINRQAANKKWQQRRPDYWRKYRAARPKYVTHNRQQQRVRDQRKHARHSLQVPAPILAKSDALPTSRTAQPPIQSGTYRMVFLESHALAKSDALLVRISLITSP